MLTTKRAKRAIFAVLTLALCGAVTALAIGAASGATAKVEASNEEAVHTTAPNPFVGYVEPDGAELTTADLRSFADEQATIASDPTPSEVYATRTAYQTAVEATGGEALQGSGASGETAYLEHHVALVVLRGNFQLPGSSLPGEAEQDSPVMWFIIDLHTGFVDGRGIQPTPPQNPNPETTEVLK